MQKIAQGAEAVISKRDEIVVKERVAKSYRIKEIDEKLRKKRTRLEARLLREAARAGVATPRVVNESVYAIEMEFVEGKRLKDTLNRKNFAALCKKVSRSVATLHNYGIIHGDLTTSNMILSNGEIYFIDFGLGYASRRAEDKATDLHLLKEAFESAHFEVAEKAWKIILAEYGKNSPESDKVIKTLSKIEKRGRYSER